MKALFSLKNNSLTKSGFTIVELVVTVAIFAFMTAFLVAKYGTFNQSVLVSNLAYDVALTIHTAQSYALNVESSPTATQDYSNSFNTTYKVSFSSDTGGGNKFFTLIANDGVSDHTVSTYNISRGMIVSDICMGDGSCSLHSVSILISFTRPDPDATISSGLGGGPNQAFPYAEITLKATDGSTKKVIVRSTGQIAVSN